MRNEAIYALRSLADQAAQLNVWIELRPKPRGFHRNLNGVIAGLYDDSLVLPEPERTLGTVLESADEVETIRALGDVLDPLIDRLQDGADADYVRSPEWPEIVERATRALELLTRPETEK